jgi:hypothetical protein
VSPADPAELTTNGKFRKTATQLLLHSIEQTVFTFDQFEFISSASLCLDCFEPRAAYELDQATATVSYSQSQLAAFLRRTSR